MRRTPSLVLPIALLSLLAGGCASSSQAQAPARLSTTRLAGGDSVGRQLFRTAPEFEVAVTHSAPAQDQGVATVPTDN